MVWTSPIPATPGDALRDDAILLFVSAAGFAENVQGAVEFSEISDQKTLLWTLDDLYSADAAGPRNIPIG